MNADAIKIELKILLDKMGFGNDIEAIDVHEGMTGRISLRLLGPTRLPEGEVGTEEDGDGPWGQKASPSSMLIGEYGNNLLSLEYLLKRILQKKHKVLDKFTLDINDYRMKKLEDLKQDVKVAAKEVRLYRKDVPLHPMSAFERRIVHLLLAEYPDITTESIGQEPDRKVIIKPYP